MDSVFGAVKQYNRYLSENAANEFARLFGVPVLHASHSGRFDGRCLLAPGLNATVRYASEFIGRTQIVAADVWHNHCLSCHQFANYKEKYASSVHILRELCQDCHGLDSVIYTAFDPSSRRDGSPARRSPRSPGARSIGQTPHGSLRGF